MKWTSVLALPISFVFWGLSLTLRDRSLSWWLRRRGVEEIRIEELVTSWHSDNQSYRLWAVVMLCFAFIFWQRSESHILMVMSGLCVTCVLSLPFIERWLKLQLAKEQKVDLVAYSRWGAFTYIPSLLVLAGSAILAVIGFDALMTLLLA